MSKLGQSIRRIARYEELRERIRRAEELIKLSNKETINGKRGAAYTSPNGFISSDAGAVGGTGPTNGGNTSPTEDEAGATDGTAESSTYDGDAIKDNTSRPNIGEEIGTITLEDCATGDQIDVNISTKGATGENIFKAPDGWGTANSAPTPGTVYAGYFWTAPDGTYHADSQAALNAARAYADTFTSPGDSPVKFQKWVLVVDTNIEPGPPSPTDLRARFTRWEYTPSGGGSSFIQVSGPNLTLCAGPYGDGRDTACADSNDPNYSPAVDTKWPEGTVSQLSWNAQKGGFFSSKYDTGIPAKYDRNQDDYSTGLSKLDLCTPNGDPVTIQALDGGGFLFFSTSGGNLDTNEDILKFDANGKYEGTITETEYNGLV